MTRRTNRASHARRSIVSELICVLALVIFFPPAAAADETERSGDALRVAIPAAAWALTWHRDDREGRHDFYQSFAANVIATYTLKGLVEKERIDGSDDDAFPSGHASAAFQGAAFLHRRYGLRRAWWAYALAGYTGWTRIDADEHDSADVLAGAAVGIASSFLLTQPRDNHVVVAPEFGSDYVGIRFQSILGGHR
jgi:membrane-associated phospholipid phosphatase